MTTERYIVVNITSHAVATYDRDSRDILIVLILPSERDSERDQTFTFVIRIHLNKMNRT